MADTARRLDSWTPPRRNPWTPPRRRLVVLEPRKRGSPRKLSAAEAAELVRKASQGVSVKELSKEFGISLGTTRIYCYRAGVVPHYLRSRHHRSRHDVAGEGD